MNVALLGLGTMGLPMARNLLARKFALTVWNRTAGRAAPLMTLGAKPAPDAKAAAAEADVVITMLADDAAVRAVYEGPEGIFAGLGENAVAVDMSTVSPEIARSLADQAQKRGAAFLDAPVSGSVKPATDGTLLILAGGDAAVVERARPVLETMGRIVHVGATGAGMSAKLVLNGLGAHMLTGLCANLVLAKRLGLSPRTMLEVIQGGAFSSPLFGSKGAKILSRDFRSDFTLRLMQKDQELVFAEAERLGYSMPTEEAILDVVKQAAACGYGEEDMSSLVRLFESWAGVEVTEERDGAR